MKIAGSAAVVTGAASGLGQSTARALAARGCDVVALDLAQVIERVERVAGVTYMPADVTRVDDLEAVFQPDTLGDAPLRGVVNCAGIAHSERIVGGVHDPSSFACVVEINLVDIFLVTTMGASTMAQNEPDEGGQRGLVINTASIAAIGWPGRSGSVRGLQSWRCGLTLPAARDLASHGIRVCAIAPGNGQLGIPE